MNADPEERASFPQTDSYRYRSGLKQIGLQRLDSAIEQLGLRHPDVALWDVDASLDYLLRSACLANSDNFREMRNLTGLRFEYWDIHDYMCYLMQIEAHQRGCIACQRESKRRG